MKLQPIAIALAGSVALAACGGSASEEQATGTEGTDAAAIEQAEAQLVERYIEEGKELISVELEPGADGEFAGELRYEQAEGDVYSSAGEYVATCTITPGETAADANYSCSTSPAE